MKIDKITRIEVIDYTLNDLDKCGRVFIKSGPDLKIELSFQDDNRTLKVFLMKRGKR